MNEKDEDHRRLYDLAFGKRPQFEIYDTQRDPDQLKNVVGVTRYFAMRQMHTGSGLDRKLRERNDPRATGEDVAFDEYPYLGGSPKHPLFHQASP